MRFSSILKASGGSLQIGRDGKRASQRKGITYLRDSEVLFIHTKNMTRLTAVWQRMAKER
jgi:hypothetical protein